MTGEPTYEELVQRVRELETRENRYRLLFDHMSSGFALHEIVVNENGNPIDYVFLEINSAFETLTGLSRQDVIHKKVTEVLSGIENDPADWIGKYGQVALTGREFSFEHYSLSLGRWYSVQAFSHKNGQFATIFEDVTERRRVEEALRKTSESLQAILDNSPLLISEFDLEGRYIRVNHAVAKLLERHSSELIGKAFSEILPAETAELFMKRLDLVSNARKPITLEDHLVTPEGDHYFITTIFPLFDASGQIRSIGGIAHNITERKQAELLLEAERAQLSSLFKYSGEAILLLDLENHILDANKGFERIFGYSLEEARGKIIKDLICPNRFYHSESKELDEQSINGIKNIEIIRKHKDGKEIDVRVSAGPIKLGDRITGRFVVFDDITERKRSEREDRLNKARLEIIHKIATMSNATDKDICDVVLESMVDITDSAIGFLGFLSENEEVMKIHAWSSSAMAECAIYDKPLEFPIDQAGLWGEAVRNRKPMIFNDYEAPHPSKKGFPEGHVQVSRFMAVPVFDGDRIVGIAAVGNSQDPYNDSDVTQLSLLMDAWWEHIRRRRTDREKEELQARLAQAHKMEAIGTLAGGIAHDFNNILSIIVGNSELAMLDVPEWSPAQDNLKEVREATLRARDLVKQILMFARQKEHTVSNIRLKPIAKETIKMLRASIPTTVKIRKNIREGLPSVLADPSQIQQIIINLCTNAGQVMEAEGGTLTFTLDTVDTETPLHTMMEALPPGRYVRMQVKDTGSGIPPEILDRIFDPFFTTKGVGEGTGLGLAVVHGIVQDRKGGIIVESVEGQGTTFFIYLPASEVESVEVKAEQKIELPRGTERVLFVDDEAMILNLGQRMLERLGYKVETRASGTDALECFRQDPHRFDLLVTDMTMPGMRGDRLAEEFLAMRPEIPVILCTGYSRQISKKKAQEIGIRAFVMKPLTQHELANTVRKVLDEKPQR